MKNVKSLAKSDVVVCFIDPAYVTYDYGNTE